MADPVDGQQKQDTRFKPGQSGNPAGRAPGVRNRATLLAEKLMADDVEGVVKAVLLAAMRGDMQAARLVLDRLAPPPRGRTVAFTAPKIVTAADVADAMQSLVDAISEGTLTPDEGSTVAQVLEARRRAIETSELEARIAALEGAQEGSR